MCSSDPGAAIRELASCRDPLLIGIRHHSPALAVAVPILLEEHRPDVLAIELPPEAAGWIPWLAHPEARAPLAMTFSQDGEFTFYPFADFSPELAALRWACEHDVPVECIDLPIGKQDDDQEDFDDNLEGDPTWHQVLARRARAKEWDFSETWDRLVEAPAPSSTPEQLRVAALAHGWAGRVASGVDAHTRARENRMRERLAALRGRRVAAVVGSFHAAALLLPAEPAATDETAEVLGCVVPYTFAQLDSRSGYPAGIRDPGWQQAVFDSRLEAASLVRLATAHITEVTRALRAKGHPAGPGEAAETLRVALDLASLRGLPAPSRRELIEATTTVLAQGEVLGRGRIVAEALSDVLIGQVRGRTAPGTPASPLRGAIQAELAAARIDLDKSELSLAPLRGSLDLTRHVLFTRLLTGGIALAVPEEAKTSRGADTVATRWRLAWTAATDASIEFAAVMGLTPEQVATTALLTRDVPDVPAARTLLIEAADAALPAPTSRALDLLAPLASQAAFVDAVATAIALAEVAQTHLPGAVLLPDTLLARANDLRAEFTRAAIRELKGIQGSDNLDDARALATFVELGRGQDLSLEAALRHVVSEGSPLMQGAAAGLLLDVDGGRVAGWLEAVSADSRRALRRRLAGLLVTAAARFDTAPATIAVVDRIATIDDDAFVTLLPALRGGFDVLSQEARAALLADLASDLGRAQDLVVPPDEAVATARYDTAARSRLAALGLANVAFAPAERWRLILGEHRDRLSERGGRMASALDELYGRPSSDALDAGARGHGSGPSQLGTRQWAQEIEALFGPGEVQEILSDAASTGRADVLDQLDPDRIRPSVDLLATALSLTGSLPEARLAKLRPLVARLVKGLAAELALRLRPALTGLAVGGPTRRRAGSLDLPRTIRANLRHVVPLDGRPQVVPAHPIFRTPVAKDIDWHVIVLVDVSGSMSESVIYSALTAAILAESPALSVDFLTFSTEIIDFTGHVSDPLRLLLEVSVGGGTDIAGALRVARDRVKVPARTLLVLISDFEEGGHIGPLLSEVEALRSSGVTMLGCAALNDSGTGVYNVGIAAAVSAAGMRVAAVSPLDLARWVGTVVRGQS